jgi:hypothetical protein
MQMVNHDMKGGQVYESPQCVVLLVELFSGLLDASNENYTVDPFYDPFDEWEG